MTDSSGTRPRVLLCPYPQDLAAIFTVDDRAALEAEFDVVLVPDPADPRIDAELPRAFAVVGQPALPAERIAAASHLRAVLNVEGNFYPNVDYGACFARGIRVLGCGPAYADAVAEYALGLALDLARGISREHLAFRAGSERYVASANLDAVLLRDCRIGLLGFGNLGRALLPLLRPFGAPIRAHDPWLPAATLAEQGVDAVGLDELLATSDVLFVLASVTSENGRLLDATRLATLPLDARLVLVSRAPIVDFAALRDAVASARVTAAIDVWPAEPMPADEPLRTMAGVVLSAHRAGGIPAAYARIGGMVLDDLRLIRDGLPPARMQVAEPELVGRYRNRPVTPDQAQR